MASDHAFCAARTSACDTSQGSPLSPAATGLRTLIKVRIMVILIIGMMRIVGRGVCRDLEGLSGTPPVRHALRP